MLGSGDRIAERRIHHDDALGGGRGNVDVVDADAGASDHLEAFRPFQDLRRDLGRGTDRETVEIPDDLGTSQENVLVDWPVPKLADLQ